MLVAAVAYETKTKDWMRSWGATEDERDRSYLGDEHVLDPGVEITQAVTIDAPRRRSGPGWPSSVRTGAASTATSGSRTWPAAE